MDRNNVARDDAVNEILQPIFMSRLFTTGVRELSSEEMFLNYEFPSAYIEKIDQLIFPAWYVASFSNTYNDSSMWGQYAGSHQGACLEFMLDPDGCLELSSTSSSENIVNQFVFNVSYVGYKEVDFFKSLLTISKDEVLSFWCTSPDGEVSEIWDSYLDEDRWQKECETRILQKTLNKSDDWVHEEECRIILPETSRNYSDKEDRVMRYSVKSLSSITFGIKTSELHKKQTTDYYRSNYGEDTVSKIKLYQAYYSHADQSVKRYKVKVSGFG